MLLINSPKPGLYVVANFFSRLSMRDWRTAFELPGCLQEVANKQAAMYKAKDRFILLKLNRNTEP